MRLLEVRVKPVSLLIVIAAFGAALWAQSPVRGGAINAAQVFSYDVKAPLDFQESSAKDVRGVKVLDISYASPKGGRVPAYLVVPPGNGPFAGLVFVHWGQGDRTEFLAEAAMLAKAGAESLLIDAPYNRPGAPSVDMFTHPELERDSYIQLVVDARRSVDLLRSRPEVDATRIGYVGHSLGATWGGPLAAAEKRIKALVLMGGLPTLTDFSGETYMATTTRKAYNSEQIANYVRVISPINPQNFVGHSAPASLFFQFARHDRYITPKFAKEYFDSAAQPKQQKFYFCSHEFNDPEALMDRDQFLQQELGLKPVMHHPGANGHQAGAGASGRENSVNAARQLGTPAVSPPGVHAPPTLRADGRFQPHTQNRAR
jgi:dienelactone hydrolase